MNDKAKADSKALMQLMWEWPAIHGKACGGCQDHKGIPIYFANTTVYTSVGEACKKCPVTRGDEILMKCLGYGKTKEKKNA